MSQASYPGTQVRAGHVGDPLGQIGGRAAVRRAADRVADGDDALVNAAGFHVSSVVEHPHPRVCRVLGVALPGQDGGERGESVNAPSDVWVIDWAWATLGAAWTDPACLVLRLIASGRHTAHEAERQAARLSAFQAADPAHIDMFAAANVRLWGEIAQSSTSARTAKMAQAAHSWAAYRQAR